MLIVVTIRLPKNHKAGSSTMQVLVIPATLPSLRSEPRSATFSEFAVWPFEVQAPSCSIRPIFLLHVGPEHPRHFRKCSVIFVSSILIRLWFVATITGSNILNRCDRSCTFVKPRSQPSRIELSATVSFRLVESVRDGEKVLHFPKPLQQIYNSNWKSSLYHHKHYISQTFRFRCKFDKVPVDI